MDKEVQEALEELDKKIAALVVAIQEQKKEVRCNITLPDNFYKPMYFIWFMLFLNLICLAVR